MNRTRLGRWVPVALLAVSIPVCAGCGNGDDYEAPPSKPAVDAGAGADSASASSADAGDSSTPTGDGAKPDNGFITPNGFQGIWGSSDTDVWAVGDMGTIAHFDGTTWSLVPSGVTDNLTGIMGSGPSDVYATGDQGNVLHWDGTSWTIASALDETALLGVWVAGPGNVWTVGVDFDGDPGGSGYVRFLQSAGGQWMDSDVPGAVTLWKVWGSSATDIWLAGTGEGGGIIFRGNSNFDALSYTGGSVHGVWGTGPDDVWVAPASGGLQHWTGTAFDTNTVQVTADQGFHSLSGTGTTDVWAVGNDGLVAHFANGAWTPTPTPTGTSESFFGIWAPSPNDAWLVGADATILRWDGTSWRDATK
jgi:hypothetical protein